MGRTIFTLSMQNTTRYNYCVNLARLAPYAHIYYCIIDGGMKIEMSVRL